MSEPKKSLVSCSQHDSRSPTLPIVATPSHAPAQTHQPSPQETSEIIDGIGRIRCRAVPFADGFEGDGSGDEWPVPEWIHLCPAGEEINGRDGRSFRVDDVETVLKNTEKSMFFDVDHFSLYWDKSTEAVGWVRELEHVDGTKDDDKRAPGFWARVRWTKDGRELIASGKFRGVSPVVLVRYEQSEDGSFITPGTAFAFARCAALTNLPNLEMTMLNRSSGQSGGAPAHVETRAQAHTQKESNMDESLVALAAMMGIEAKPSAFAEAFTTLTKERDAARVELNRFRKEAEAAEAERFNVDLDREFEAAKASKRMLPAEEAGFRAMVTDAKNLETFRTIIAARPNRLEDDSETDPKTEPPAVKMQLSALQKKLAKDAGLSDEEYLDALKEVG